MILTKSMQICSFIELILIRDGLKYCYPEYYHPCCFVVFSCLPSSYLAVSGHKATTRVLRVCMATGTHATLALLLVSLPSSGWWASSFSTHSSTTSVVCSTANMSSSLTWRFRVCYMCWSFKTILMKKETFNVPQIFFYQLWRYECNFFINLLLGMVHKIY